VEQVVAHQLAVAVALAVYELALQLLIPIQFTQ
jgi:hypothetical protein